MVLGGLFHFIVTDICEVSFGRSSASIDIDKPFGAVIIIIILTKKTTIMNALKVRILAG